MGFNQGCFFTTNSFREFLAMVVYSFLTFGLTACTAGRPHFPDKLPEYIDRAEKIDKNISGNLFVLDFDVQGNLTTPFEAVRATKALQSDCDGKRAEGNRKPCVEKIILLSYGWEHELNEAFKDYATFLEEYRFALEIEYARSLHMHIFGKDADSYEDLKKIVIHNDVEYAQSFYEEECEEKEKGNNLNKEKVEECKNGKENLKKLGKVELQEFVDRKKQEGGGYEYADYFEDVGIELDGKLKKIAVFGVSWNSKQTTLRTLLTDFLPSPTFAKIVATIPDYLGFPLTYWAKSNMADRIALYGLPNTLNTIFEKSYCSNNECSDAKVPSIYLVAHSFGSRILHLITHKSLITHKLFDLKDESLPFDRFTPCIRGAVYIQPAFPPSFVKHPSKDTKPEDTKDKKQNRCLEQIDDKKGYSNNESYPIAITFSQHDHLNSLFYPLANIPLNANMLSLYSSLKREFINGYIPESLDWMSGPAEMLADVVEIPYLMLTSVGFTVPASWLLGQYYEIKERGFNYPFDSLAQLPVLEIPVAGMDYFINRGGETKFGDWGKRNKGIFNMGPLLESAGRIPIPIPINSDLNVFSLSEMGKIENAFKEGKITFIDARESVDDSLFSVNLENPVTDHTLGWIDPVGSHFHFRKQEIYRLINMIISPELNFSEYFLP